MNRFLRRAIFCRCSPYRSVLPYNINWMLPKGDPVASRETTTPIVVVDVGCRGGLPDELWPLRKRIHLIGFDADSEACARSNAETRGEILAHTAYPIFVGGEEGETTFHLFKSAAESSSLEPDARFTSLFADPEYSVERTLRTKATTLDSFFHSNPELRMPDMIKVDTQGTELAILKGATECLRRCSLVEVEVEFLPMYKGQCLFHEVMGHMLGHGFELLYLNRVCRQRKRYPGFARGQIVFGDALFCRREDQMDHFDEERRVHLVELLINYGHLDVAWDLLQTQPFGCETKRFFESYLRQRIGRWRVRQFMQVSVPFLDKLVLWLLHLRKHNTLNMDSDRSWPVR